MTVDRLRIEPFRDPKPPAERDYHALGLAVLNVLRHPIETIKKPIANFMDDITMATGGTDSMDGVVARRVNEDRK
jgi:hypothetical protein